MLLRLFFIVISNETFTYLLKKKKISLKSQQCCFGQPLVLLVIIEKFSFLPKIRCYFWQLSARISSNNYSYPNICSLFFLYLEKLVSWCTSIFFVVGSFRFYLLMSNFANNTLKFKICIAVVRESWELIDLTACLRHLDHNSTEIFQFLLFIFENVHSTYTNSKKIVR